jgi:hypothetical protein
VITGKQLSIRKESSSWHKNWSYWKVNIYKIWDKSEVLIERPDTRNSRAVISMLLWSHVSPSLNKAKLYLDLNLFPLNSSDKYEYFCFL